METPVKTILILFTCAGFALGAAGQMVLFDWEGATNPKNPSPAVDNTVHGLTPNLHLGAPDANPLGGAGNPGRAGQFINGAVQVGTSMVLRFTTIAYSELKVSYDYLSTPTGPSSVGLYYATAEQPALTFIGTDEFVRDGVYHTLTRDLSSVTAINNNVDVSLVWTGFSGGSFTEESTLNIDNLLVAAVPEAASSGLVLGIMIFVLAVSRRIRKAVSQRG